MLFRTNKVLHESLMHNLATHIPFGRRLRWFLSADSNWRSGAQELHSCCPLDRVLVPGRKIRDRLSRPLLPTQSCKSPFNFTWPKLRGARELRALLDMFKETALSGIQEGALFRPIEEQFRTGPGWQRQGMGQAEVGKQCVPQSRRSNTATPNTKRDADIIVSPEWFKHKKWQIYMSEYFCCIIQSCWNESWEIIRINCK